MQCGAARAIGLARVTDFTVPAAMLLTTHASNDTSRKADALTSGEVRSTDAHIVRWEQGSSLRYRDIVRCCVNAVRAARSTTYALVTGWHALVALCCTAFAATALASLARAMRSSQWRDKALPVLSRGARLATSQSMEFLWHSLRGQSRVEARMRVP